MLRPVTHSQQDADITASLHDNMNYSKGTVEVIISYDGKASKHFLKPRALSMI